MKKKLPPLIIAFILITTYTFSQPTVPFTPCPDVSIAVVRSGTDADITNPYYMYTVNTLTGAMTLLPGGPLIGASAPSTNWQINGVGLNRVDGFLYGLAYDGTLNTARLVRIDKNYNVASTPNIAPPSSATGIYGYVNTATGDCDRSNNYYFAGFTANPGSVPGTLILDKLYLGKIANVSATSFTLTPTAIYYEIDYSDMQCVNFANAITADPENGGFKDFVYSPFTNNFYTYITYKLTGDPNFHGQFVQLTAVPGSSPLKYKMTCSGVVNTHPSEVSGTLIDNAGNFEVLFNNGQIGKLNSPSGSPFTYDGTISVLNSATGLPNPLRGDLASCGGPPGGPLPVRLTSFNAIEQNCKTSFSWTAQIETNLSRYELEQSFDGLSFNSVLKIVANKSYTNHEYNAVLVSPGKQAYYRLKIIDLDGTYTYSKIISVANNCDKIEAGIAINPNPVNDVMSLNLFGLKPNAILNITIYDGFGKAVQKITRSASQANSFNINVNGLAAGAYFIKAVDTKNSVQLNSRFIKQ